MTPPAMTPPCEPRLLIKKINSLAEQAGALATALGLPLVDGERLLGEAKERGIAASRLGPLRARLEEIDRLKAALEEAKAQRATSRL
jgi:hypothetical protein